MDLNKLAKQIAAQEGKRVPVNIAQIKEVLRITLTLLAALRAEDLADLLNRSR